MLHPVRCVALCRPSGDQSSCLTASLKIMARDGNCDFVQLRIKVVKMTLNANGVVIEN